jgi:transcriptional regulator with XRE-family HTH domain
MGKCKKNVDIAARLEKLRDAKRLQWGELCGELGISRSMKHALFTGARGASPKLIRRIEAAERECGLLPPPVLTPRVEPKPPTPGKSLVEGVQRLEKAPENRAELRRLIARLESTVAELKRMLEEQA